MGLLVCLVSDATGWDNLEVGISDKDGLSIGGTAGEGVDGNAELNEADSLYFGHLLKMWNWSLFFLGTPEIGFIVTPQNSQSPEN